MLAKTWKEEAPKSFMATQREKTTKMDHERRHGRRQHPNQLLLHRFKHRMSLRQQNRLPQTHFSRL